MLCLVLAVAGPVMPGAGDVSPMDPTMAYGAAPTMLVFAPDGGAGFDLMGQDSFDQILTYHGEIRADGAWAAAWWRYGSGFGGCYPLLNRYAHSEPYPD